MTILPCPVSLPLMRLALMERVQFIAVHCSATRHTANIGAADIDAMHRARKFACIGYHYVIRRNGAVVKGRPERNAGAQVEGYNSKALGICLVGGIDIQGKAQNNFTPAQFAALRQLLAELKTPENQHARSHHARPGTRRPGLVRVPAYPAVRPAGEMYRVDKQHRLSRQLFVRVAVRAFASSMIAFA